MPKPKPDEKRDEFLPRCMDSPEMKSEYPTNTKQRYAVCVGIWKTHLKRKRKSDIEEETREGKSNS